MKKALFWTIYGLLLVAVTIGGLEFAATFLTPPWPAYELRPIVASSAGMRQIKTLANDPKSIPFYNSWGLKDEERSVERPADVRFRSVFVGDSFLEGMFSLTPLSELVAKDWSQRGIEDSEAINLGISATGPPQYYYRIKSVALRLQPDAILELFYSGNDFVSDRLSSWSIPPLVAERPQPSLLGAVAPHLDWLIVNRLSLSEYGRGNKSIPNEFDTLNDITKKPLAERAGLLADYYKKNYFPDASRQALQEVFGRGGATFWNPFERTDDEREFLQGWLFANLVDWELLHPTWPAPKDEAEAERMVDPAEIEATLSWLLGADRLALSKGVKFLIAVAPMAAVDPRYAAYWQPWPRYFSQNRRREAARRVLLAELSKRGLHPIDLAEDLKGISGTYRLTDGHWTELGTAIVAKRLAAELLKVRDSVPRQADQKR
ncbi:hypothetical protein [Reyranella sp.]|jgi:hypothetical protein|uniref:hypothetical protein n=1 Tax=Reyranella sp. TaxID=1929291 RepID=UPI002F95D8B5